MLFVPEGWSKKIHLQKGCVGNSVALTETVRQSQRVKADVAAQNPSLPRQTKEIGQLACATSGLEHDGTLRQLLIEGCGEPPLSRLHDEGLARVDVIIVWERRFLVERLHHVSDIAIRRRRVYWCEQSRDAVFDRIIPLSAGASPAVLNLDKRLAAHRTLQNVGTITKGRLQRRGV